MSHAPYIMPDGRPLGQYLQDTQTEQPRGKKLASKQSTRRARKAERNGGWTHKSGATASLPAAEGDGADAAAESFKYGRERRRRYLNDLILRDMAGALTASDMEALFQPVPFGEQRPSVFCEAMAPDVLPVWDLFRNVDEDKQNSTLQRWEAHLRAQRRPDREQQADRGLAASQHPGLTALKAWSRIPRKTREALKRSSHAAVEALEMPILEFMDQRVEGLDQLDLDLEDGFQRLLTHGLAVFHGLHCRTLSEGGVTRLQHFQQQHSENPPEGPPRLPGSSPRRGSPPITCADIVFALSENPAGGLSARSLDAQLRRNHLGSDADSNASFVLV